MPTSKPTRWTLNNMAYTKMTYKLTDYKKIKSGYYIRLQWRL